MSIPDNHELEPSLALERLPALVGLDIVPVDQELEAIRSEEAQLVDATLPQDSMVISPVDPAESLVLLAVARNLERKGDRRAVYIERGGELYVGHANGTADWYGDLPNYRFTKVADLDSEYTPQKHTLSFKPTEPWSYTPEGLEIATQQVNAQAELKDRFVEEHPLGEGALLITNRYGGIDPTDPQGTTRSLLTRFIYANELGIPDKVRPTGKPGPFVEHGLLDERLEGLLGKAWLDLRHSINPSLVIVEQMKQAGQDVTPIMSSLEGVIQTQVESFLQEWGSSIMLAAQLLRDPATTDKVLSALAETDKAFAEAVRYGSFDRHRVRR